MKVLQKMLLSLIIFLFVCTLSSCTQVSIQTYSDELVNSVWHTKLDNDTQIMLSFSKDEATMKVSLKDGACYSVSGLCEVSENIFVIYDEKTDTPYAFEYIVHFDRVNVKFLTNTVSLYKT